MRKTIKAIMLSAFVFPGIGHFYLKKHIQGTVLTGSAFVALYFVASKALERALEITDKILGGEALNATAITELLSKQPDGLEATLFSIAWIIFIILWLIGIADSYRIGRVQDNVDVVDG